MSVALQGSKGPSMSEATSRRRRAVFLVAAAALAGLAAGSVGVYVSGWGAANGNDRCEASADLARSLKPLAHGEVAALLPADAPQDLSTLVLRQPDGTERTLGSLLDGKATLLNLWATWCVPCRAEMPALDRLQAARGGPDFQVLTLNVDTGDPAKPAAFLAEIGTKGLPDWRDPRMAAFNALKGRGLAFGLPTTLLIDRKGCQVAALHGPAEWDSADAGAVVDAVVAAR
ncbi:thiol:disulfide interchange protein TlpA [Oharaeibacter diazotrophicus]